MRPVVLFLTCLCALVLPRSGQAVTVAVGDADGFGIDPAGLMRASGTHTDPADADGDGILEVGEFLPDWDLNGSCAVGSNDSFDFREADEVAGTDGWQHTDLAIEGSGNADLIDFVFVFDVPVEGDADFGVGHFINFVFGDYDVVPTEIDIDGTTVELDVQGSGNDGLVQSAFAGVSWEAMTDGEVVITVHAPNEPYLAFDYTLLDTARIADSDGDGLPEALDNCPSIANLDQADSDEDGAGDVCDNCPGLPNASQSDLDGDGAGDLCDDCPEDATDDADGDGWCAPEDCDPADAAVNPDGHEVCDDGLDNDCDGTVDQLPDVDGDGWDVCAGDCDEGDDAIHPEAEELCDGLDNDCDGELGPGEVDDDGDGFTECGGDCDDEAPGVFPGAELVCEPGVDADCDGVPDLEECDDGDWGAGSDWSQDCGCAQARPAAAPPLVLLLLLLALRRRRS